MKKHLLLFFALLPISLLGQITFTQDHLPNFGDVLVFGNNSNVNNLSPGSAGPNQMWDFSNFATETIESLEILNPEAVASSAFFPDATYVGAIGAASFIFLESNDTGLFTLGAYSGDSTLGLDLTTSFIPPRLEISLPLNYQDTFSTKTSSELNLDDIAPGSGFLIKQQYNAFNEVDAFGTMKLSSGEHEVLRVRRDIERIDSTFLLNGDQRTLFSAVITLDTAYEWFAVEARGALVSFESSDLSDSQSGYSVSILDVASSRFGDTANALVPIADFRIVEGGDTYFFFDNSTNLPTSWLWDFGDGNSATLPDPTHQYEAPGVYTVCLIATNEAGSDTLCKQVEVLNVAPIAGFSYTDLGEGTVSFTNLSQGEINQNLWSFGDGAISSAESPTHQYATEGNFEVCLTVFNDFGTDSTCQQIEIRNLPPISNFGYVQSGQGSFDFIDSSANNPQTWLWDFDDGNTSSIQNPNHQYAAEGTYTVCLIVGNAQGNDTSCQMLVVENLIPVAAFGTDSIGIGLVQFSDQSSNMPTNWLWDFGDGNTSTMQNPRHQYRAEGAYTICLTSSNTFGTDSTCQTLRIENARPIADFTFMNTGQGTYSFTDISTNNPSSWLWDFGDGNTSSLQNPDHQFNAEGTYTVCLIVNNLVGSDTLCQQITVENLVPVAAFSIMPTDSASFDFTDQSSNMPTSWMWDFGDGSTTNDQNPSYTFTASGTYNVCLTASNAFGMDTTCDTVQVIITNIPILDGKVVLEVAPNPFRESLTISLKGIDPKTQINGAFIDINGRMLWKGILNETQTIFTSDWTGGVYLLQLSDKQGQLLTTYKLIHTK